MISKTGETFKMKKPVVLYCETSLEDYFATEILELYEDTQEPEIIEFLSKPQQEEYYITLRFGFVRCKEY
jgi:hypothetical protein